MRRTDKRYGLTYFSSPPPPAAGTSGFLAPPVFAEVGFDVVAGLVGSASGRLWIPTPVVLVAVALA
ncbi:MAG: hypothetical protein U0165_14450 [Polyangiaceae bacterium]